MNNRSEKDIHRKLAGKYGEYSKDRFYLIYQSYWNDVLLDPAPVNCECIVLDCGCGIGKMLEALSSKYKNVYGIDLSEDMLRVHHSAETGAGIAVSDAQRICLKDNSFDLVICKGSLHHLPRLDLALREINRILTEDGMLIISEPCRDNFIWRNIGSLYTGLSRNFSDYHTAFRSNQLKTLLSENGFKIIQFQYFGYLGFPLCILAHQFPLIKHIPHNHALAGFLVKLDRAMLDIPVLRKLNWHAVVHAVKSSKRRDR